jgi:hypothetical protein
MSATLKPNGQAGFGLAAGHICISLTLYRRRSPGPHVHRESETPAEVDLSAGLFPNPASLNAGSFRQTVVRTCLGTNVQTHRAGATAAGRQTSVSSCPSNPAAICGGTRDETSLDEHRIITVHGLGQAHNLSDASRLVVGGPRSGWRIWRVERDGKLVLLDVIRGHLLADNAAT